MRLLRAIALLAALGPPGVLEEPGYLVAREGDGWVVRKPGFTVSRHRERAAAELRSRTLPRLRLSRPFVRFDPVTNARTPIADWTGEADARDAEAAIRGILDRFAPAGIRALLQSTGIYMARLAGATGHTAEESADPTHFAVYLDPYRATGRLHTAATILHELTHVERFRARGFHANRAAAVLPKQDFVLLGLADEFEAYQAEANLVRAFLEANPEAGRAARDLMRKPELRWPVALTVMLGFEGPDDEAQRTIEARRQVVLDVEEIAGGYWEARHRDPLHASLREVIRRWHLGSPEWREIAAGRAGWFR